MARKKAGNGGGQEAAPQPQQGGERRPPAHEVRIKNIRGVVWENHHSEQGKWFSVIITRSYKQGETWKSASSYGRDDLLTVAEIARLCWLWIAQQQGTNFGGNGNGHAEPPSEEIPI